MAEQAPQLPEFAPDTLPSLLDVMGVTVADLGLPADPLQVAVATTQTVGDGDDF